MRLFQMVAAFAIAMPVAFPAAAAEIPAEQRKSIERVIEDYLLRNPEVIERAMEALEARREAAK